MFPEYILLFKYFFFCLFFVLLLFVVSFFFVLQSPDAEKYSPYECGFNPYEDARLKFEIHFYLVGILFIIFDLEIIFLFPWVVIFYKLTSMGIFIMLFFMLILTIGFAYEWVNQALDWD